jgi:hypothetical protein
MSPLNVRAGLVRLRGYAALPQSWRADQTIRTFNPSRLGNATRPQFHCKAVISVQKSGSRGELKLSEVVAGLWPQFPVKKPVQVKGLLFNHCGKRWNPSLNCPTAAHRRDPPSCSSSGITLMVSFQAFKRQNLTIAPIRISSVVQEMLYSGQHCINHTFRRK